MAISPQTQLLTDADLVTALGDSSVPGDTVSLAVLATKAYVQRFHSEASVTAGDPAVVTWPYDFKIGAIKLAAGLVRSGFSAGVAADPNDPFSQATLKRLTDIEIEQLLQIGRFDIPRIG